MCSLLAAATLSGACRADVPAPTTPAPSAVGEAVVPARPPAPAPPAAPTEPPEAVRAALTEIRVRQSCNRVMGCAPAVQLAQYRAAAVPWILAAIHSAPRDAGYWVVKLVDLLGQLGGDESLPLLHALLDDPRWELRAVASLALARLGRPASRAALESAWALHGARGDVAFVSALLHALDRTGDAPIEGRRPRDLLAERLPREEADLAELNPGFYAFLARVVREARLPAAAPLCRLGAIHRDRFVRAESVRTLGTLGDTGGIPYLVTRLDDELPSVRRAVIASLQQITGSRQLRTPEAWRAWCDARDCLATLRGRHRPSPPPAAEEADSGP